jgi:hypothetical protein
VSHGRGEEQEQAAEARIARHVHEEDPKRLRHTIDRIPHLSSFQESKKIASMLLYARVDLTPLSIYSTLLTPAPYCSYSSATTYSTVYSITVVLLYCTAVHCIQ